jgi:hypothetical protein
MTYFTAGIDAALASTQITDAEFVRVTVYDPTTGSGTAYAFSTSYKSETFAGSAFTATFTPLGGLVSISGHQRDLSATAYDTQITLIGVDQTQVYRILEVGSNGDGTYHAGLKGSKVELWRGFYDTTFNLIDTPQLRYTGIVTSYHISEERQQQIDTFTLTLQCSSYKTVLENRFSGRHTNGASWNKNINPQYDSNGNPTNSNYDSSMDRVQAIHDTTFNFGMPL